MKYYELFEHVIALKILTKNKKLKSIEVRTFPSKARMASGGHLV